jgi:hypothetical protein
MNKLSKIATAVAISLGIATVAIAQPGEGRGMGAGAQQGQHQGMQSGMGHGQKQGMKRGDGHGKRGEAQGHGKHGSNAAQSLATPEERTAMREKMRNAKTPEERQQIALANRAEMQKRAAEKGITLPEHREGRGHGQRRGNGPATAPATPESAN